MSTNIVRLNDQAHQLLLSMLDHAESLHLGLRQLECGATLVDFGIEAQGGLGAGTALAAICMAGLAEISILPPRYGDGGGAIASSPLVQVISDDPVKACMGAQYAGWPVKGENFFAMGSGPMRAKRGREPVLQSLSLSDQSAVAVGVLECDQFPTEEIAISIAEECQLSPRSLFLCVAPTRSIAGTLQVVARSIETSLHKLHELHFDLQQIKSGWGVAPLPPPATDFVGGIGRTNDAILYGGQVTLWVDSDDATIESIGKQVPSCNSKDFGKPFSETFKAYEYDFYKVDPGLFSPAVFSMINLNSGKSWRWGAIRPDVLDLSFCEIRENRHN